MKLFMNRKYLKIACREMHYYGICFKEVISVAAAYIDTVIADYIWYITTFNIYWKAYFGPIPVVENIFESTRPTYQCFWTLFYTIVRILRIFSLLLFVFHKTSQINVRQYEVVITTAMYIYNCAWTFICVCMCVSVCECMQCIILFIVGLTNKYIQQNRYKAGKEWDVKTTNY